MAFILADMAYLLAVLLDLAAFLLFAEWLVHSLPGSGLNGIRRVLFRATLPLLKWSDSLFTTQWGGLSFRGLGIAVLLLLLEHCAVPWLVLLSYSLRG